MSGTAQFEIVLALLAAAVLLSAFAQRLRVPPAAAFVIGGMALAVMPGTPAISIDPNLILLLFLPPLLQASAFFTVWRDFWAQLEPILLLAIGAVAFTTLIVGCAAKLVMPGLPWAACFALGAIVSPPDAVAAKAVLERLPLPRTLVTILEGESLINDASSLVLYRFAVAAALSGSFSATEAAVSFVWLAVCGIAIGIAFGYVIDFFFRRMRDPYHIVICSFLVGWASYIVAERLHVSGVLAVVSCGLIMGRFQHETLTAHTRTQARAVWQIVVFVLEALVFVLIGLSLRGVIDRMNPADATLEMGLTLIVTTVVVLSRFAWIYSAVHLMRLRPITRRLRPAPPASFPLIVSWAGMRGVVSLAAALALPANFPGRDAILFATFGVILITVLLQGGTLGPLVARLRLGAGDQDDATLSEAAARAHIMQASAQWLETLLDPNTGAPAHPMLLEDYRRRARVAARFVSETEQLTPVRHAHFETAIKTVAQGRRAMIDLHRAGKIHDSLLHTIEAELDLEELRLRMLGGFESHPHEAGAR